MHSLQKSAIFPKFHCPQTNAHLHHHFIKTPRIIKELKQSEKLLVYKNPEILKTEKFDTSQMNEMLNEQKAADSNFDRENHEQMYTQMKPTHFANPMKGLDSNSKNDNSVKFSDQVFKISKEKVKGKVTTATFSNKQKKHNLKEEEDRYDIMRVKNNGRIPNMNDIQDTTSEDRDTVESKNSNCNLRICVS